MFKPNDLVYYKCQPCWIECIIDRGAYTTAMVRKVALIHIGPKRVEVPLEKLKKM
ncbi:hypothetical protein GNF18_10270 [Ligilactobacillus pobuzihii]|uniref:hypothetical protein n=1 Tax=Ligilactobacillus pobuzihii TaxID=449659 RepID=UPI0019D1F7F2|nr:hypothetical protein [Ligilactobacillus pobuzihii]MBN7275525.1 hypothetical protein [Ligilactobacillus pobuzihii]